MAVVVAGDGGDRTPELLKLVNEGAGVSAPSAASSAGGGVFRKDCTDLVRRISLLTHLLEEVRDFEGQSRPSDHSSSSSASASASSSSGGSCSDSDLVVALQASKCLLSLASGFSSDNVPSIYTLTLPVEDHFVGRVTYRGTNMLHTIRYKFENSGLKEKFNESPFNQFLLLPDCKFSGSLVHALLLRRINSSNDDEFHFGLGRKDCRFGQMEFGLITGLKFAKMPSDLEVEQHGSDRLLKKYFNDSTIIKVSQLMTAFSGSDKPDDVWKLGHCLLVEGVLYGKEPTSNVWTNMLKFVEDSEFFNNFPWGNLSWHETLRGLNKNMTKLLTNCKKKLSDDAEKEIEAKYTVYGFSPALQYWAYEAVPDIGASYGTNLGNKVPRMLSWTNKKGPKLLRVNEIGKKLKNKSLVCMSKLNLREAEKDYYEEVGIVFGVRRNILVEDEMPVDTTEENVAEVDSMAKEVPVESKAKGTEHVAAPPPSTGAKPYSGSSLEAILKRIEDKLCTAQPTAKNGIEARLLNVENVLSQIVRIQETIMEMLKTLVGRAKEKSDTATASGDEKIYEDICPDDNIVPDSSITSADSVMFEPEDDASLPAKRKRTKPCRLADYTDPTTKRLCMQRKSIKFNPLKAADSDELGKLKYWIVNKINNKTPRDVKTGDGNTKWFIQLLIPQTWLLDSHIDAMLHLLRRRCHFMRKTYSANAAIMNLLFYQTVVGHVIEAKNNVVQWDENIMSYVHGIENQFFVSWKNIDDIYLVANVNRNHWVVLQVDIASWTISIYDSDIGVVDSKKLGSEILPFAAGLPYLLLQSHYFDDHPKLQSLKAKPQGKVKLPCFALQRVKSSKIPQSKNSGDCGMYAIKHVEHLMAKIPLDEINDANMERFREKWAVDLFFQHLVH